MLQVKHRRVQTADEFNRWLRRELAIGSVTNFVGDLAHFRKDASKEIVELEALVDKAKPTKPIHPQKRFRLENLRRDVELTREAQRHGSVGNVLLTQERTPEGQFEYIATRPRRRSTAED